MYYIIDTTYDSKVIGPIYPQCQKLIKGYDEDMEGGLYWLCDKIRKKQDVLITPSIDCYTLSLRSKVTNALSTVCFEPFLDKKTIDIISQYNIGNHQIFQSKVLRNKIYYDYYYLYLKENVLNHIDLQKSVFIKEDAWNKYETYTNISSIKEFNNLRDILLHNPNGTRFFLDSYKIFLKKSFSNYLDIFDMPDIDLISRTYISQRLKEHLERENITGLTFTEATNLYFEE